MKDTMKLSQHPNELRKQIQILTPPRRFAKTNLDAGTSRKTGNGGKRKEIKYDDEV